MVTQVCRGSLARPSDDRNCITHNAALRRLETRAYEILAPFGAGGIGEVYKVRDTKLGGEVAMVSGNVPLETPEQRKPNRSRDRKRALLALHGRQSTPWAKPRIE